MHACGNVVMQHSAKKLICSSYCQCNTLSSKQVLEEDTTPAYIEKMARAQGKVEAETRQLGKDRNLSVTRVPLFDVEIRNIHGLRAMAGALFG